MMKIYFDIETDHHIAEGRASIAFKIKDFLKKKGFIFVDNPKEADLIHIHSSGITKSFWAYKIKKKYNIPCLYSLYSNSKTQFLAHTYNFIAKTGLTRKISRQTLLSYSALLPLRWRGIFLKKMDLVIVPNWFTQKRLFENTQVIHLGIDTKKFKRNRKQKRSCLKVAYFGHPSIFKGLTDFVEASKTFPPEVKTYIFFTKPSKRFEEFIKKKNPSIRLFGFIEDINRAYNEIDIVVLPYRNELGGVANPLVLLEAMAAEKAVITTNLKFIKEIVKDSALLIPPYSPKEIVKAVTYLTKNPHLREILGKKARKIILHTYNQEKMFNQYLGIYQELKRKLNL